MNRLLSITMAAMLSIGFGGCAETKSFANTQFQSAPVRHISNMEIRLNRLEQSCERSQQIRLAAADSVMELVIKKIKQTNPAPGPGSDIYDGGQMLFRLAISFYNDNLTVEQCRIGVNIVREKLMRNIRNPVA